MRTQRIKSLLAVLFALCVPVGICAQSALADDVTYDVTSFQTAQSEKSLTCTISGSSQPVYTVSERFSPFRVVVDIAGGSFAPDFAKDSLNIAPQSVASLAVTQENTQQPHILRFEFTLADTHDYTVERAANDIVVKFFPAASGSTKSVETAKATIPGKLTLRDLAVNSTTNATAVTVVADSAIELYNVDTVAGSADRPPRMFVDIPNVAVNELVAEKKIGTSVSQIRVAKHGDGVRIVFDSATPELFKYTVAPSAQGLSVVIDESGMATAAASGQAKPAAAPGSSTLDELIDSSEQLLNQSPDKLKSPTAAKATELAEEFSFSGYNKQRISVDFYKIDIHNVFRLFRQITDLNIIIDEDVQGSLTLALTDVPWDFALDIVLNLMDLKKEERFNTIVIYPAKKEFVWPTRAEDNLSFEADLDVIEEEALVIEKTSTVTPEVMKAKEYMAQARMQEEAENFEAAATLYLRAFDLWPTNVKISNRLATIYLVNLGMNAKAVFYAKETLKNDPQNAQAALYAAIASANMQRIKEASDYFSQSVSGTPPMKEALISYASFSENNGQNDAAIKLLDKYHSVYGETVDTMVAKARILDKLGLSEQATKEYKSLLASGFQLRPDLKKYIEGRISLKTLNQ